MDQTPGTPPAEIPPPEVTRVESRTVWCDGAGGIRGGPNYRPAALGHPRVYLQIDDQGYADCGYCDRRFVLVGGPADGSTEPGIHELAPGHLPEPEPGGAPGEGLGGHGLPG
jgi:uncharacterized Zn-finger protein